MPNTDVYLENCLFFTAGSLSRVITKIADDAFAPLGMSTSHAFLVMLAIGQPEITQKTLSEKLNLAQSTVSRFVDALIRRGLLKKHSEGKSVRVSATQAAHDLLPQIETSWKSLYTAYCDVLGESTARKLTEDSYTAYQKLIG